MVLHSALSLPSIVGSPTHDAGITARVDPSHHSALSSISQLVTKLGLQPCELQTSIDPECLDDPNKSTASSGAITFQVPDPGSIVVLPQDLPSELGKAKGNNIRQRWEQLILAHSGQ